MGEAPSLFSLCINAVKTEVLYGDDRDLIQNACELPSDLFDSLLTSLPPVALHKLQQHMSFNNGDDGQTANDCIRNQRKRKRYLNFDMEWRTFYKSRWPDLVRQNQPWLAKQGLEEYQLMDDWEQMYWEAHLQNCLDEAAEIALLPSFDGCISKIRVSGAILNSIGYEGHVGHSRCDYSKLSYHCQQFAIYARCVKLLNVLCNAEICHLLSSSKLQHLELRWIKSQVHVEGLCLLLKQKRETIRSLEFVHCKLSSTFFNAICDSLLTKCLQTHEIEDFSIKTSSFLETDLFSLPGGLATFLLSGRHLSSLSFCDVHVGQNFAKMVFRALLDAASGRSLLDHSGNHIAGYLSHYRWNSSSSSLSLSGLEKSLQSLHVLCLRGNNIQKYDVESLKHALVHMPNLETLDISDNALEDDGVKSLVPYFIEISRRHSHFSDLKVENCELSCNGVIDLLDALSTLTGPLDSLSIGGNDLGSKVGAPLGKFLGTGIRALDIEDIGLGSSGFLDLKKEIRENLKLVCINMSKNRGGIETAKFLATLIAWAPNLVAVNASYNFMPFESLLPVCSALKAAKGKLEQVDLTGINWSDQSAVTSILAEFQFNGKPIFVLPSLPTSDAPYDDDP